MDRIDLPFVPADTSVERALAIMSLARRAGLVTRIKGKETVLEAEDLLGPGTTADMTIARVAPARATGMLPPDPLDNYLGTETALDSQQAHFGIFDEQGEFAVVITRHEGIAFELRATPSYFVCKGVRRHMYSSGTVPGDRICPNDSSPIEQILLP